MGNHADWSRGGWKQRTWENLFEVECCVSGSSAVRFLAEARRQRRRHVAALDMAMPYRGEERRLHDDFDRRALPVRHKR